MARKDDYVTSVHLSSETVEELDEAKDFFRQMEKDLNRDPADAEWRVDGNLKFDKDEIIRRALEQFNQ